MFTVTGLGHQGWLLGTQDTHLLIDPVLTPRFARMPLSAPRIYPPRVIDLAAFPAVDAVLITHEHPDHLDFESLQLLDTRVPVYISAHTSEAARRVIASLGLDVRLLVPGVPCVIGAMEVVPISPYVIGHPGGNEVDIILLLVSDRAGHGNFFTSVDTHQVPEMVREVRRHIDRPGIWSYANNAFDQSSYFEWLARPADAVREDALTYARQYAALFDGWGHPEALLVNGDGVTLGADLARLNAHVFPVANDRLVDELRAILPGHVFQSVRPGVRATMREGVLTDMSDALPFLSASPRSEWPPHGGAPLDGDDAADFPPGTGRTTMDDADGARLESALADFGRFLFARASYRGIYRLMAGRDHPPSMLQTMALALRHGEPRRLDVWEFRPERCSFVKVSCEDPRARYVAGGEFWATDVLAALTFQEFADDLFHFGRKRLWNAAPEVFRLDVDTELQLFGYALRAPEPLEILYRRCLASDASPELRAPDAAHTRDEASPPRPRREPKLRAIPAALASRAGEPEQTSDPLPEALMTRLGDLVLRVSDGSWTLTTACTTGGVLRATLSLPGAVPLVLDAGPLRDLPRHYKSVGNLAFRYGPGAISDSNLGMLNRLIEALAPVLSESRPA